MLRASEKALRRAFGSWATVQPKEISGRQIAQAYNLGAPRAPDRDVVRAVPCIIAPRAPRSPGSATGAAQRVWARAGVSALRAAARAHVAYAQ